MDAIIDSTSENELDNLVFGMETDSFLLHKGVINANEFLSDILLKYHVSYSTIHEIAMASEETYDVYLDQIHQFLNSQKYYFFTSNYFSNQICKGVDLLREMK